MSRTATVTYSRDDAVSTFTVPLAEPGETGDIFSMQEAVSGAQELGPRVLVGFLDADGKTRVLRSGEVLSVEEDWS